MNYTEALARIRKILAGPLELDAHHIEHLINKIEISTPDEIKRVYDEYRSFYLLSSIRDLRTSINDRNHYQYWNDFQFVVWRIELSLINGKFRDKEEFLRNCGTPEFMKIPTQRVEIYE